MKRFNIKTILADPAKRRRMVTRGTVVVQAREGVDISLEQALESYDRMEASGELARARSRARNWGRENVTERKNHGTS